MCKLSGYDQSVVPDERLARGSDSHFTVRRQRYVGRACVPSREGPLCLAVPDDEAAWGRHGRDDVGCLVVILGKVILVKCERVEGRETTVVVRTGSKSYCGMVKGERKEDHNETTRGIC